MSGGWFATAWATVDLPGWHHWPDAPPHRSYLRAPHRHLFRVRAEVVVNHDDRDVEFHDLQDVVREWWEQYGDGDVGPRSCETLARLLAAALVARGFAPATIDVSEDQENGATVRFEGAQ